MPSSKSPPTDDESLATRYSPTRHVGVKAGESQTRAAGQRFRRSKQRRLLRSCDFQNVPSAPRCSWERTVAIARPGRFSEIKNQARNRVNSSEKFQTIKGDWPPSAAACPYADDDLNAADLGSGGRQWDAAHRHILARDVLKGAARCAEEMVMIVNVRIEIRAPRLDHDFAQQAGGGELVENVVNQIGRA